MTTGVSSIGWASGSNIPGCALATPPIATIRSGSLNAMRDPLECASTQPRDLVGLSEARVEERDRVARELPVNGRPVHARWVFADRCQLVCDGRRARRQ